MKQFIRICSVFVVLIARFFGALLVFVGIRICFVAATTEEAAWIGIPGLIVFCVGVLFLIAKTGYLGDGEPHNAAERLLFGLYANRQKGK